jgi:hypothetical protein
MPTLYNYAVQVDQEVEVDIDLELQEIASLVEDEFADFIASYASTNDIAAAISMAGVSDVLQNVFGEMTSADITDELRTYCKDNAVCGEALQRDLRNWLQVPEVLLAAAPPTLAELFTMEEVATLESARRAVSAIHSLTLVEAIMQRNYAPGNPWLDTLNNLDALLAKIDPSKKEI